MRFEWARNPHNIKLLVGISILVLFSVILSTCSPAVTPMQEIRAIGELRVVTRENPSTYFLENGEPDGFEYELAKRFAEFLDVRLNIYPASVSESLRDVEYGRAHIAAAGLSITEARKLSVDFGPSYQEITQQLLAQRGQPRPEDLSELVDYRIAVLKDSSHQERMIQLQANFPKLYWDAIPLKDTVELMRFVDAQEYDLTIVDSAEFAVTQRYFPKLRAVFDISEPEKVAWATPHNAPEFQKKIKKFFQQLDDSGELDQIKEYYFGYIKSFDYVEVTSFTRHIENRLPKYIDLFKKAGHEYDIDWKLLAAISYQESHWRKNAVSATGVRGLMMLTEHTAKEMKVTDRTDPAQSIDGGTRYLLKVMDKIPHRIQFPDRLWFALAGYNVGFGHLEDARILTDRVDNNPDLWSDVREYLPLLSDKKYYSTLKRGKARGEEPVKYVENIRNYYDLLRWLTRTEEQEPQFDNEVEDEFDDVVTVPQDLPKNQLPESEAPTNNGPKKTDSDKDEKTDEVDVLPVEPVII